MRGGPRCMIIRLGSDQVGMPMRGGPRSIIKLGSDQVGDADVRRTPQHKHSLVATKREMPYARRRLQQIHARRRLLQYMYIFFFRKNR